MYLLLKQKIFLYLFHIIINSFWNYYFFIFYFSYKLLQRTKLELYGGNVTAFDTESGPQISYNKTIIGMYIVIDADIGLTVLWDRKTTVHIILEPQHMVSWSHDSWSSNFYILNLPFQTVP